MLEKALVIGAGLSGIAAAKLLLADGYLVTITDKKDKKDIENFFEDKNLYWDLGSHTEQHFKEADLIVVSPGVSRDLKYLKEAKKNKKTIIGELELAASKIEADILAITGSNGKTTATALLSHIFNYCEIKNFLGGNIGFPLSNFILNNEKADVIILELSSFQLETINNFKAKIACILNMSPDHLDRYTGMPEYFKTKTNIFNKQSKNDFAVINEDDILSSKKNPSAKRISFSVMRQVENGAYVDNNEIVLILENKILAKKNWKEFQLWGLHNQENVLAATSMALVYGLNPQKILDAAATFKADKHRIEFICEARGVKYYNDSKATNVGAVIKALENFNSPVHLIAGGRDKDLDFKPLYNPVKEHVKQVILIGEAKNTLQYALNGSTKIVVASDMAEAVKLAVSSAEKGEIVLLSPACASYDMFKDYEHRGDVFIKEVKKQCACE